MDILNNFSINDNRLQLNKHKIVVRNYLTVEKINYDETTYYLTSII